MEALKPLKERLVELYYHYAQLRTDSYFLKESPRLEGADSSHAQEEELILTLSQSHLQQSFLTFRAEQSPHRNGGSPGSW